MKTNKTILLAIFSATLLFACSKDELAGPQGPQGPQGVQGPQGPAGESNIMGTHTFEVPIFQFSQYSSNGVWQYQTNTSQLPSVNSNSTVIGFMAGSVTSSAQWVAMPYNHYWNNGSAYVKHYYAISPNGRIWLYMRHSNGGVPYSNQNSSTPLGYRFFLLKKSQVPDNLDINSYEAVENFAVRNPDAVIEVNSLDFQ